jgi:8-oxo-dGTP diphosphatase
MINVTCAIIRNEDDEVLIVQRGESTDHPFKWEFPGGKINEGESEEDCIIREIKEELSIDIVIRTRLDPVIHDYGHKRIRLIPFICDTLEDLPFLSEHMAFEWVEANKLKSIDFSQADVFVAQNYFSSFSSGSRVEKEVVSESMSASQINADLQNMVNSMISMKEADWIATSAIENPAIFNKLLEYSFSDDKKLAFRASWTLTKVCDKFPEIIYPFLPYVVESLNKIDNESAQRSFLRIISLSEMDKLSTRHHGILAEHCFGALKSGLSAIAIKAYAMEIIYNLVLIYPELHNELSATINMMEGEGSAGIVARGRMILKKLAQIPIKPKSSRK